MPETIMLELGWPLGEKAQKEIDDKKRKPSKEIRIEAMRDAVEFAQRTSGRGRGKVVLVYPAERMNHVTANALLKTLEEPAGDLRFVLASEAAHQLLPTIRSRCLGHTMAWPGEDEAVAWLQEQGVQAAEVGGLAARGRRPARRCAASCTGRPRPQGLGAAAQSPGSWRQSLRWPTGRPPRPSMRCTSSAMTCWPSRRVPNRASSSWPTCLPPASFAALSGWSRELTRMARTVEHPFNAGLMLEALVSQARSALNSRT